ncbi:oxidoreductase [Pokkaliibacter plantistimulans]|uniref:Oxidoreductase n=1 Tax=Proteobacteria bacterium 228 TaxID=2083153 RepID=A0A2S5KLG0_9PROT|nr:SDR family oxidoreductase [Pokkaliibacter plantistimulans]PPC75359.1 oxidoreductase [Pokkaliibacter plantistimulans]
MSNIQGKTALVTGASSGIGAATALKLAAAGAKVGLAARRVDRLVALQAEIVSKGGEAIVLEMDVSDAAAVNAGVEKLVDAYGTVDILFNNAGIMPLSNVEQLQTADWNRMIDINLKGVLHTTAAVLPHMIKQHAGHIFSTSSVAGRKATPGLAVYSATKFAVAAFSEGLRMEVGQKHNIRVTCIQPGLVATELGDHIADPQARAQLAAFRDLIKFMDGADIADAVLFAAQAPSHVNVAELYIMPTQQA